MATTDPFVFKEIDGVTYRCRKLQAMRGFLLTTELARHLGAPLVTILAGSAQENVDLWTLIQYVIRNGLDQLYPEAAAGLMLRMMEAVMVNGTNEHLGDEARFNKHFDAQPNGFLTAIEVWVWALEVNFKNFFDVARSRLTPAAPGSEPQPTTSSPSTSTT